MSVKKHLEVFPTVIVVGKLLPHIYKQTQADPSKAFLVLGFPLLPYLGLMNAKGGNCLFCPSQHLRLSLELEVWLSFIYFQGAVNNYVHPRG